MSIRDDFDQFMGAADDGLETLSGSIWDDFDNEPTGSSPLGSDGDHGYASDKPVSSALVSAGGDADDLDELLFLNNNKSRMVSAPKPAQTVMHQVQQQRIAKIGAAEGEHQREPIDIRRVHLTESWQSAKSPEEVLRLNAQVYKEIGARQQARLSNRPSTYKTKSKARQTINAPISLDQSDSVSVITNAHGDPNSASARYARLYRQEKKTQVVRLQQEVTVLTAERDSLRRTLATKEKRIEDQSKEIDYLRSVIANESSLAPIISRVLNVAGEKLMAHGRICILGDDDEDDTANTTPTADIPAGCARTRASARKRQSLAPTGQSSPAKRGKTTPGLCVHLNANRMSVEMCSECAHRSQRSVLAAV